MGKFKKMEYIDPQLGLIYKCDVCKKICKSWGNLKCHYKRHDKLGNLICSICKNTFNSKADLHSHLADHKTNHRNKKYFCKYCGKSFEQSGFLFGHEKSGLACQFPQHKCKLCEQKFYRMLELNEHFHNQHISNNCEICDTFYSNKCFELRHHMVLLEPYKCPECDKKFSYNEDLRRHFFKTHNTDEYKMKKETDMNIKRLYMGYAYLCDHCGKVFSKHENLRVHLNKHYDINLYKCDICSKSFSIKSSLKMHKLCHSGAKPYKCNYCFQSFSQLSSLRVHSRQHFGKKQYWCKICFKNFQDPKEVNSHTCQKKKNLVKEKNLKRKRR